MDSSFVGNGKHDDAPVLNNKKKKMKYKLIRRSFPPQKQIKYSQRISPEGKHLKASIYNKDKYVFGVIKKWSKGERYSMLKEKKNITSIIDTIIGIIALGLSVLNFLFGTYPYLNEKSDDMSAKAKAGDAQSQFFLADYYYSVRDYEKSVYWYKLLCRNTDNPYGANSYNNWACAILKNEENSETQLTDVFLKDLFSILFTVKDEHNYYIIRNTARLLGYVGARDDENSLYWPEYISFFEMIKEYYYGINYKNEIELLDASWKYVGKEAIGLSYSDYVNSRNSENDLCFFSDDGMTYYSYIGFDALKTRRGIGLVYACRFEKYIKTEFSNPPIFLYASIEP